MPVSEPRAGSRRDDVLARLAEIIHLVTERPVADVRPDRAFVDDLRVDSLAMVEILEGAARRFDVEIEDEAAKGFVRVGDLVDYLHRRI
jgi:acyl carrier protein